MTRPADKPSSVLSPRHASRRAFLGGMAATVIGFAAGQGATRTWLGGVLTKPQRSFMTGEVAAPPITISTPSGIRIHGIQTGLLAAKQAHAALQVPAPLRLLSIILDQRWTELLPILTWVIEHPEGLVVVDTGEVAAASDIDSYMADDPFNRWFFKRNIPMFVSPAEELATQMLGLGLNPDAVRQVVLTHLHGDHAGGLEFFPNATFWVARAEYEGHLASPMGAVRSLWPSWFSPALVDYTDSEVDSFPNSFSLSNRGDLLLLPTPGHSYGHQSVLLREAGRSYLFAGDIAFSEAQLRAQEVQGISANVEQASLSLRRTWQYVQRTPTVFLPTHDPGSLRRLEQDTIVVV